MPSLPDMLMLRPGQALTGDTPVLCLTLPAKAWVLSWRYSDGSNGGVERVYLDEARARADHELVSSDATGCREWKLDERTVTT
jgi:hypothetical protein